MSDSIIQQRIIETMIALKRDLDEAYYPKYSAMVSEMILKFNSEFIVNIDKFTKQTK